jgi:hypothetical protein
MRTNTLTRPHIENANLTARCGGIHQQRQQRPLRDGPRQRRHDGASACAKGVFWRLGTEFGACDITGKALSSSDPAEKDHDEVNPSRGELMSQARSLVALPPVRVLPEAPNDFFRKANNSATNKRISSGSLS